MIDINGYLDSQAWESLEEPSRHENHLNDIDNVQQMNNLK